MPGCPRVAVVTGANKGIGYEIVKGLCERFDGIVYLTSRDKCKGVEACQKLQALNLEPKYHKLDVTSQESCDKFRNHIKCTYGGLDVLVNNAAIYFSETSRLSFAQQAERTIETNYFGVLRVCNSLFGLLRPNARVVNMTSRAGHLSWIPCPTLRSQFKEEMLSINHINCLMEEFVRCAKCNTHISCGWGNQPYSVSKIGVSALTIVQQKCFDCYCPGVLVNCVHPGDVKSELSNYEGDLLPCHGAQAPLFLCLLPPGECVYRGSYVWYDKKIYDWYGKDPHIIRSGCCQCPCPNPCPCPGC